MHAFPTFFSLFEVRCHQKWNKRGFQEIGYFENQSQSVFWGLVNLLRKHDMEISSGYNFAYLRETLRPSFGNY